MVDNGVLGFDTLTSRVHFRGQLVARTGLRIGSGRDNDVAGHDLPVMRDASGRPFIPGASFRGVLRSFIESLLRGLSTDPKSQQQNKLACEVLSNEGRCIPRKQMDEWRESKPPKSPEALSQLVFDNSCLVCQTFGSTWLASHIAVRDLTVEPSLWFGQFEIRQGVSIDRDTETAGEGLLYSFETIPAGTRFDLEIEGDNLTDWQKGLLFLGLQPFLRGEITMGGARSRGLGRVELIEGEWRVWDSNEPENKVEDMIKFLSNGPEPVPREQMDERMKRWQQALKTKLAEVVNA